MHSGLYETCATITVAVAVVMYFEERFRRNLSPRARGSAVGYLGFIIGTVLGVPVLALAGFVPDSFRIRLCTVLLTMGFMLYAFRTAIQQWGAEDRRTRSSRSVPALTPDNASLVAMGLSERERAAKILGAVFNVLVQAHPQIIEKQLAATGATAERERLRLLGLQFAALQPELFAVSAGYPSASVRDHLARFLKTAADAFGRSVALFAEEQIADDQRRAVWRDQAAAAYTAADEEWRTLIVSLHARRPRSASTQQGGPDGQGSVQGGAADAERAGDLGAGTAVGRHPGSDLDSLGGRDGLAAELLARGASGGEPGEGSLADEIALEFGQGGEHVEGELARGRGIDGFAERAELDASAQVADGSDEVGDGAAEAVEALDH
jgi:hypothetical protein